MSVPPFPPPAEPRPAPEAPAAPAGITLAWFPEESDFIEAFRAIGRRTRTKAVVQAAAIGALCLALGAVTGEVFLVVAGIGLVIATLYAAGPGRTRAVRTMWRRSPALQTFHQLQVSPESGVTQSFPGYVGSSAWSRFSGVVETERVFVLRVNDLAGEPIQVVPKRGLPPEVDPRWFADALRSWIGAQAGR